MGWLNIHVQCRELIMTAKEERGSALTLKGIFVLTLLLYSYITLHYLSLICSGMWLNFHTFDNNSFTLWSIYVFTLFTNTCRVYSYIICNLAVVEADWISIHVIMSMLSWFQPLKQGLIQGRVIVTIWVTRVKSGSCLLLTPATQLLKEKVVMAHGTWTYSECHKQVQQPPWGKTTALHHLASST